MVYGPHRTGKCWCLRSDAATHGRRQAEPSVRCDGKDRKQLCTPLRRKTLEVPEAWGRERAGADRDPRFPTIRGTKLRRYRLNGPIVANKQPGPGATFVSARYHVVRPLEAFRCGRS